MSKSAVGHAIEVQEIVSVLARVAGRLVAHHGAAAGIVDGLRAAQAVLGHLGLERGDVLAPVGAHGCAPFGSVAGCRPSRVSIHRSRLSEVQAIRLPT